MTEDTQHKDNMIKLSKALNKYNRYSDMLPCNFNLIKYSFLKL